MRVKWGLLLAAFGLFVLGIYLGILFARPPAAPAFDPDPIVEREPAEVAPRPAAKSPAVVIPAEPAPERAAAAATRPKIALVIDDLGRSLEDVEVLASLGIPMTYAVLPFEVLTPQVVRELGRRGEEIFCHLPMEAKGGANPGPGALRSNMAPEELAAATRRALEAVPGAVGANNHMGSSLSSSREAITPVLEVLAQRGLYYLDSRTTADTVAYSTARQMGLQTGERQVFLDTDRDKEAIRRQFVHLLELARKNGRAIAIAHPYPETLEVLLQEVPQVRDEIQFVRASSLMG